MSVQAVGNEVKTLLRSGVDVRVKLGRARINLTEGGTIALCGPAHISMLKVGKALTVALDSGIVHAHVEGNLNLNIFTAQILAKTVAIGNGPQDVLVGFDAGGVMCVRASQGALRLEEQFSGQNVMVPQGGDVTIANGQLQGLRNSSGLCACDSFENGTVTANAVVPEISTLASSEELKKNVAPRKPAPQVAVNPPAPEIVKPPAAEPTYQVFMPPLRYDANAKVQEEPDMKMVMLVRRVRVKPTLIFQSRVEGDLPQQRKTAAAPTVPAKTEAADTKKENTENASVMNRVKTFIKSLWSPSS
jgi:ribosomal protein S20